MGAVIVESPSDRLVGRTSTLSGTTMATPDGTAAAARQAATGYALRAPPSAACRALKDLHHFLGHDQLAGLGRWDAMPTAWS
jgi:hypothetical protein